ncbi:MAG: hypothetical protein ABGZ17_30910 [Planctomycetaceae bacterium]
MSATTSRSLEDCLQLEYLLLGELAELLEEPLDDQENRRWLMAVVGHLLTTLRCECNLLGDNRYMSEVVMLWPNWSPHVERLCIEQRSLRIRLEQLSYRLSEALPLEEVAERLGQQLREWMLALSAHRRHETRLLQTAFNFDCGEGL